MNYDKLIEQEIAKNPELKAVFDKHPERKELYKQKLIDAENANYGCRQINPIYCRTCAFAHGEPPFEDNPEKAYCEIYKRGSTRGKPQEVYYDGEECEYYVDEKS